MSSKLIKNGTILSFDDETQRIKIIENSSVFVKDDTIAAIFDSSDEDVELPVNIEVIDATGSIISPGFVNTHIHSWQSAYRSMGPNITLLHYFPHASQISGTSRSFSPEDIYISSLQGYLEGLNAGVTSFVDHAHNTWSQEVMRAGFDAAIDSGARVAWCPDLGPTDSQPDLWAELQQSAEAQRPAEVTVGLALDGLCRAGVLAIDLKEKIEKYKLETLTYHHLDGLWPSTKTPTQCCQDDFHTLPAPIILSHAPYLSSTDISTLRDTTNLSISITPESEFHYGHGQTTGHLVLPKASLGIDTNWTFSGDMLTQTRLYLQHIRNVVYQEAMTQRKVLPMTSPIDVEQAFLLATRQGAKAMGRDADLGVLRVGAKADLLVFRGDSPNLLGWTDPVAAVVLHANVGDIQHVLVGGQWRKRDGHLILKVGELNDVKARFCVTAEKVQKAARTLNAPVPDNMFGHGTGGACPVYSTVAWTE